MAELSSITLPNGNTYNFKDNNAIPKNEDGNTQYLKRPTGLRGSNDLTLQGLFNATRANRLAFLPPDQIIIEKTIDGGTTWTDAEVSDNTKLGLFSETRNSVNIPLIDGVRNPLCGIRVTFTAMKYNVPSGTIETEKYNYWNSNYVLSTERYNNIKQFYFWLSSSDGSIGIKIQGAKGSSANSWQSLFNDNSFYMIGWSGSDYVRLNNQYVFGGKKNQTSNSFWNYRITFMSKGKNGTDDFDTGSKTQSQNISQIRAYGDSYWNKGNEYAATDKIYTHDYNQNVTFPAKVTASDGFSGNLTGNVSGNATNVTGTVAIEHGGTGATSAAAARTNLGLGSAALASTAASVGNNTNLPTGAAVQTYVSNLVDGVLHYKGTKSTVADLPTSDNTTGDVWHVTQNGSEWIWDGSAWQEFGRGNDGVGSYHTTITKTTNSTNSFTIAHYLNTKNIMVSALVNDGTNEYLIQPSTISIDQGIVYCAKVTSNDAVQIIFNPNSSWSALEGTIKITVITTDVFVTDPASAADILIKVN